MKFNTYITKFVDKMPEKLEDCILYISPHYNCAMHNCMCGCGEKVCTPLDPGHWKWSYNGENVSLNPSIGNFQYKCKSHYFLVDGKVRWCNEPLKIYDTADKECQQCQCKDICLLALKSRCKTLKDGDKIMPHLCEYIKANPNEARKSIMFMSNVQYGMSKLENSPTREYLEKWEAEIKELSSSPVISFTNNIIPDEPEL